MGFPTGLVRGVVAPGEIVSLGLPDLEGLIWREGALIPATRLAPLLGLTASGADMSGHGVLIRSEEGLLCLLVDEALDLVEAPIASVVSLPSLVKNVVTLEGVESAVLAEEPLLIVDPVRLLGRDRVGGLMAAAARMGNLGTAAEKSE